MTKPIAVIYLPENFHLAGATGVEVSSVELMRILNGNFGDNPEKANVTYTDYWNQYYWFCFPKRDIDAPEFKVFYEKDFTEIQFSELKQMVEDGIKQISSQNTDNQ